MRAPADISVGRPRLYRELGRWGLAGAVVVAGHFSLGYGVAAFAPVKETPGIEEAMTVELTPLVLSEAEPVEVESVEEDQPEIEAEVQEETPAEPEQTVEEAKDEPVETAEEQPVEEPEQVAEEEPIEELAPTPEVKKAEVVLPRPVKPKPVKKPKPVVKKEPPKRVVRKTETPSERPSASRAARAGRSAPAGPRVNPARWISQVTSAIHRRKPRSLGKSGVATIRFTVNSAGAVTSSAIARSSGDAALDRAAVSMARGARVPPPPPGVSPPPFTMRVNFQ